MRVILERIKEIVRFYLGTDAPYWLWNNTPPHRLFISNRRLVPYRKTFKRAKTEWALDSGGFTELNLFGKWQTSPESYIRSIRCYSEEIGKLQWAAPQDWMCEPGVLKKTGKTVEEHQELTVKNFEQLRDLAADLPIIPVLQGWQPDDYHRHRDLYATRGIDLTLEPLVGMGTLCRRVSMKPVHKLLYQLHQDGMKIHGFGVKSDGLPAIGHLLESADSLAWSLAARMASGNLCGQSHNAKKCNHCRKWATTWANRTISKIGLRPYQHQLELFSMDARM